MAFRRATFDWLDSQELFYFSISMLEEDSTEFFPADYASSRAYLLYRSCFAIFAVNATTSDFVYVSKFYENPMMTDLDCLPALMHL